MDVTNVQEMLELATSIIGVLSIVASVTPTPIDNVVLLALKKAIDFGAFNFFRAKNKD
jgi:hypothetical protein